LSAFVGPFEELFAAVVEFVEVVELVVEDVEDVEFAELDVVVFAAFEP